MAMIVVAAEAVMGVIASEMALKNGAMGIGDHRTCFHFFQSAKPTEGTLDIVADLGLQD